MTFDFHFRSPSTGGGGNPLADSDKLAVAAAVVGRALLAVLAGTTERGVAVVAWAVVGAEVPVEVRAAVGAAVPVVVRMLLVVPVEATGLGVAVVARAVGVAAPDEARAAVGAAVPVENVLVASWRMPVRQRR